MRTHKKLNNKKISQPLGPPNFFTVGNTPNLSPHTGPTNDIAPGSTPVPVPVPGPISATGPNIILERRSNSVPNSSSCTSLSDFFSSSSDGVPLPLNTTSSSTPLANILRDFNDHNHWHASNEGCGSSNNDSLEIGVEADDEQDDEDDNSSVCDGAIPRKPGQRYTELDFDFLDEDWLHTVNSSSEEISSDCSA